MPIVNRYITNNPYYNDGKWLVGSNFTGFFLHSVGCAQPDPLVFINAWDKPTYTRAGVNGFIGQKMTYITAQCLTETGKVKRMPHAGRPANDHYIGFEMTEPKWIKYNDRGTAFTVDPADLPATKQFVLDTFNNAVELFAKLCIFHGKDPLKDGVILSHREGAQRGIATNHGDPEHLWKGLNMDLNMDKFRRAVKEKMEGETELTRAEVQNMIDESNKQLKKEMAAEIAKACKEVTNSIEKKFPKHYQYLKDVKEKYYRPTIDKLLAEGVLKGTGGSGEDTVLDFNEDAIRIFVILDRAGVFDLLYDKEEEKE